MNTQEQYIREIEIKLNTYTTHKSKLTKESNLLSTIRLLIFVAGIAATVLAYIFLGIASAYIPIILSSVAFIYAIIKHQTVINKLDTLTNMIKINQSCIDRTNLEWTKFPCKGDEYVSSEHPYSTDLDIFGNTSLYQWINSTHTLCGKKYLSDLLKNPDNEIEAIIHRQKAIKELSEKADFCQQLQCEAMKIKDTSDMQKTIFNLAESRTKLFEKSYIKEVFYLLPALTLISLVLAFLFKIIPTYIPAILIVLHLVLILFGFVRFKMILEAIYTLKNKVAIYKNILSLIESESFKSELLVQLKSNLYLIHSNSKKNKYKPKVLLPASKQIRVLEGIVNAIDLRYNPYIFVILNVLFLWDFNCLIAFEEWKAKSGQNLRIWLETIGQYEALLSLAQIAQMNPDWVFPNIVSNENGLYFSAKSLGHPLIVKKSRVSNSITLSNSCETKEKNNNQNKVIADSNVGIITGSNMSGKTTFLRTVGINLVLAYAGAPVCAKHFSTSVMNIYTSMRITDDLNSGISTFYAELLRIKLIVDAAKDKTPFIFLLDEIFRGTNSTDRVLGAKNVILNLAKPWSLGLISTHDFDLCKLDNDGKANISNYHFTEAYRNNEIIFDYRLRPGKCQTTNARHLMRMVGIELVE